jgi:PTH1 family peptidyl-tRNA hydrolase
MNFEKFLFGLGNPGPQYAYSPHNLGFLFIDRVLEKFPHLSYQKTRLQEIWVCRIGDRMVMVSKPKTFMNLSGQAVREVYEKFWSGKADEFVNRLIVAHDEVELADGEIKLKDGKVNHGHRGHNGLRNIGEQLRYTGLSETQSAGFMRIRFGCSRPTSEPLNKYLLRNVAESKWREWSAAMDAYLDSEMLEKMV